MPGTTSLPLHSPQSAIAESQPLANHPNHMLLRHGHTNAKCTLIQSHHRMLLHLWTLYFQSKLVSSSSVMSASLNVTFLIEPVLMLPVRLRQGLCSRLERECLMTCGWPHKLWEPPPAPVASSQDKSIMPNGEGQDFSHTSLAAHSPMTLDGAVFVTIPCWLSPSGLQLWQ